MTSVLRRARRAASPAGAAVADRVLDRLDRGVACLPAGSRPAGCCRASRRHQSSSRPHLVGVVLERELGRLRDEPVSENVDLALALDEPDAAVGKRHLAGFRVVLDRLRVLDRLVLHARRGQREPEIGDRKPRQCRRVRFGGRPQRASWATARLPAVRWSASTRSCMLRERRAELERRAPRPAGRSVLALTAVSLHRSSRPYRPLPAPGLGPSGRLCGHPLVVAREAVVRDRLPRRGVGHELVRRGRAHAGVAVEGAEPDGPSRRRRRACGRAPPIRTRRRRPCRGRCRATTLARCCSPDVMVNEPGLDPSRGGGGGPGAALAAGAVAVDRGLSGGSSISKRTAPQHAAAGVEGREGSDIGAILCLARFRPVVVG